MATRARLIYADPPWSYADTIGGSYESGAEDHYDVMNLAEIRALPLLKWRLAGDGDADVSFRVMIACMAGDHQGQQQNMGATTGSNATRPSRFTAAPRSTFAHSQPEELRSIFDIDAAARVAPNSAEAAQSLKDTGITPIGRHLALVTLYRDGLAVCEASVMGGADALHNIIGGGNDQSMTLVRGELKGPALAKLRSRYERGLARFGPAWGHFRRPTLTAITKGTSLRSVTKLQVLTALLSLLGEGDEKLVSDELLDALCREVRVYCSLSAHSYTDADLVETRRSIANARRAMECSPNNKRLVDNYSIIQGCIPKCHLCITNILVQCAFVFYNLCSHRCHVTIHNLS
jgi:hypothetical protein